MYFAFPYAVHAPGGKFHPAGRYVDCLHGYP
jgi:hypothetical protein